MHLQTGQILNNRYRVVSSLGEGGFGAVYRVWDLNMERPRALKENLDISPEAQNQFKRESQILDTITHPNLPKVLDHFILQGIAQYLVMEFIEGEDLQEKLTNQGGPLPESLVVPWMIQICDALEYLHNLIPPIIHRDIKPANIKITPHGRAILVDFGIAKVYDPVLRTTIGARAVTPGYSPPEQYGQGRTDVRTDIYALGATLHTVLSGITPPDSIDILTGREPPPDSIRAVNPKVSIPVEQVIKRAMKLNEQDRFRTITDFKAALIANKPEQTTRPGPGLPETQLVADRTPSRSKSISKRKPLLKWKSWVAGLIVFVGVLFFVYLGINRFSASKLEGFVKTTQISPKDRMVMVYVPGGSFEMGSEGGHENQLPVHATSVEAFWMDETEVTNAMYVGCVEAGVCRLPLDTDYIWDASLEDYPVNYINWEDAQSYCEWVGRQLPSEAMWERAARGGLVGENFPWGDKDPVCTTDKSNGAQFVDCGRQPAPVKTFQDNGYGLYDMAGNLWEWVVDIYKPYPGGSPGVDSEYGEGYRVVRGGSFYDGLDDIGNAVRMGLNPHDRVDYVGFRCALLP